MKNICRKGSGGRLAPGRSGERGPPVRSLFKDDLAKAIALEMEYADIRIAENRRGETAVKNGYICAAVSGDSAGFEAGLFCRGTAICRR